MNDLEKASQLIKNDDLVVIPTETVYGLAASIYSETAIIFHNNAKKLTMSCLATSKKFEINSEVWTIYIRYTNCRDQL